MHTGPMPDSAGDFSSPVIVQNLKCRQCKLTGFVTEQRWDSRDGAYEDYRYHCSHCGKTWWEEGIDT